MNLNELLMKHNFITKIMFKDGDDEISKDLKIKIMEMRIEMGKIRKQFEEDSQEVANQLMPEGYQQLAQKSNRTEEEEARFKEQTSKLNSEYGAYTAKRGTEEVTGTHIADTFTSEEYNKIVSTNGSKDVDINGTKIPGPDFLEILNTLFCN